MFGRSSRLSLIMFLLAIFDVSNLSYTALRCVVENIPIDREIARLNFMLTQSNPQRSDFVQVCAEFSLSLLKGAH